MSQDATALSVGRLSAAFAALRPLVQLPARGTARQVYALADLGNAFAALSGPLAEARDRGGILNPWSVAGLRRDEVRNAAALAGLWSPAFGGRTSRRFLAGYLARTIPTVDWQAELQGAYRVTTEENPLGEIGNRVDIVIETASRLIAIEVKIDAGLGDAQLERYLAAIGARAKLRGLVPHLVLLAPFPSPLPAVAGSTWRDIARAARDTIPAQAGERGLADQLIACFGDHVLKFGGKHR